jgi:hypothetical protein
MTTLDKALQQFEATEANLAKLENLWEQIEKLLPNEPAFGSPPKYDELCLAFRRIIPSLPAIDGFRVTDMLFDFDEAGQMLLDAAEIGEISAQVSIHKALEEQGRALREYRFKLQAKRRELARGRVNSLIDEIDIVLSELSSDIKGREINSVITGTGWERLKDGIEEIDTLFGSGSRPNRWNDLQRHMHFGMVGDLSDIIKLDWPAVKNSITSHLYGQDDPVPVSVDDLNEIIAASPTGPATTKLNWDTLTDEDFERLIYLLISETSGYENPQWLQKTHAPDRGRDLSVDRVVVDPLAGVRRYRTIIQCKHWLSRSIGQGDVADSRSQMELWQPPRIDNLVIATTGRFTADAISLVEQHNLSDRALNIEMWPDSHIERLLAMRPHLIGQFRLRRGI